MARRLPMPLPPNAAPVRRAELPSVDSGGGRRVQRRRARGAGVPSLPTPVNSLKSSDRTGRRWNAAWRRVNFGCCSLHKHNKTASPTTSPWNGVGRRARGFEDAPGGATGQPSSIEPANDHCSSPYVRPPVRQPVAEQHANPRPGLTVAEVASLPRQPGAHCAREWAEQVAREGTPGYTGHAPVSPHPRLRLHQHREVPRDRYSPEGTPTRQKEERLY